MTTTLFIAAFLCLMAAFRIHGRANIPTEGSTLHGGNRRKGWGLAATLNLRNQIK